MTNKLKPSALAHLNCLRVYNANGKIRFNYNNQKEYITRKCINVSIRKIRIVNPLFNSQYLKLHFGNLTIDT